MKTQFYSFCILIVSLLVFRSTLQAQDTTVTNLPCFYITTKDNTPISDRETWLEGTLKVAGGSPDSGYYSGSIQIRGRGNSTWLFPKKPYRIKLASKYNLLGMPAKEKNWVLLANYADKTLMRNAVAFEASKFFGFAFSPSYRMADVFVNGEYEGTYTITDQMEVAPDRINIEEQEDTDTTLPAISGGYLLEVGASTDSDEIHSVTTRGEDVSVKYPDDDDINQQQISYIQNYVQEFENTLFSPDFRNPVTGYHKYADTKSLTDWYLLSELCSNPDMYWSGYMYKHRDDSKLYWGPIWDFDLGFNNYVWIGDVSNMYMRDKAFHQTPWLNQFFEDKDFYQSVRSRWFELENAGIVKRLQTVVDSLRKELSQSQKLNFQRWPILNTVVFSELEARGTYNKEVNFLKKFINVHSSWLSDEFSGFDSLQSYRIISGESDKLWDVKEESKVEGASVVHWSRNPNRPAQIWKAINLNNGYYKILNVHSGKVITNGGSLQKEAQIYQTDYANGDSTQQWRIINTGGKYGLINRASLQAADNFGGLSVNNTPLTQYPQDIYGRINQFYYIRKAPSVKVNIDISPLAFSLYPNPVTTGNVNIHLQLTADAPVKVFIYDTKGLLIRQVNKGNLLKGDNSFTFSAAGLHTGNYTITVKAGKEMASQLLLVK